MSDEFRHLLMEFIRRFGLLAGDQTPCGKPLPTSDAHALMCLRAAGEAGLLQTVLAARLGLDKSTVSRLVVRLTESGHVTSAVAADARARPIRLTRKGTRLAGEIEDASKRRFSALLEFVPALRRDHVIAALRDVAAAMDGLETKQQETE